MAEITVDYYDGSTPSGKVKITPRNNGYEWTKTDSRGKLITKEYCSTFNRRELSLTIDSFSEQGYFRGILVNPSDFRPISFNKADALKLYDFFTEQMEWSPDALKSGTAHPDLLAAQQRHTVTAATPSAGGGGGGGSRKARKTRKSRKSRKSRK